MGGNIEGERKRRLPDDGAAVGRMPAGFGRTPDTPVTEVDSYYSRPDVDYVQTVECLRVRRRGDFSEITCKPPTSAATHSNDDMIAKKDGDTAGRDRPPHGRPAVPGPRPAPVCAMTHS